MLLVCGIYVPCDAETNVKWFRKEYDKNTTSPSMPVRYEITSQCINMSRSNKCEVFHRLYKEYNITLYPNKTGMDFESYQCQITTENNTVSLLPFLRPFDLPQEAPSLSSHYSHSPQGESKCNSSRYNCVWCRNMSIPACEIHLNFTEPSYNLTMTETYACTPYSIDTQTSNVDSFSISSTLTRGYSNNQVATMSIEIPTGHATSDTVVKVCVWKCV